MQNTCTGLCKPCAGYSTANVRRLANKANLHGPVNVVASSCQLVQSITRCHRQSMQIWNITCNDAHKVHETLSVNNLGGTSRLTPSCPAVVGLSDETSGALRIPQPGGEATPHGALQG